MGEAAGSIPARSTYKMHKHKKITFKNNLGNKLVGIIESKLNKNKPTIVICHGYKGSKNSFFKLAKLLNKENFNILRFDFSSHGESEGSGIITVDQQVNDLLSAINYLKTKNITKNINLFGFSLGGTTAILYTAKYNKVKSLVLGSPASISNFTKQNVFKEAKKIKCPKLIIHGTADDLVPIWQSEELVKRIPNAKLESIKEADHIYSNKEHDEIFNNLTIKFFKENA